MKKTIGGLLSLSLVVLLASCASKQTQKSGDHTVSTTGQITVNTGDGKHLDVKPVQVKPVELKTSGAIPVRVQPDGPFQANAKVEPVSVDATVKPVELHASESIPVRVESKQPLQANAKVDPVMMTATVKPITVEADVKPVRLELDKTTLNAVVELKLPSLPGNMFPSAITVTSAPVVVNCGGNDCKCDKKERGRGDGQGGNPNPGTSWWIPILAIIFGGTFGRVVSRILVRGRDSLNLIEREIAALEKWILQQINDYRPSFPMELRSVWRRQAIEEYLEELKLLLANLHASPTFKEAANKRMEMLLAAVHRIRARDNAFLKRSLWRDVKDFLFHDFLVGTGAAGLVPVFLSYVSSNLFLNATNGQNIFQIAIFSGYCLMAGMLGSEFIAFVIKMIRGLMAHAEKRVIDERQ